MTALLRRYRDVIKPFCFRAGMTSARPSTPRARTDHARLTRRVSDRSVKRQRRLIDLRRHRHPP